MLIEQTLFEKIDKIKNALTILKDLEPSDGYYVADSGGKDSCVIIELVKMANVKADYHHSLTTIDPPEVIYYLRKHHPETVIERPKIPFLQRMVTKGFPIRQKRWCCAEYKERGGSGRLVITGIRKAESNKRAGRKLVEFCYKDSSKRYLNVIIDWTEKDVWEFIKSQNIPYCSLYDTGNKRIGCLFCPMAYKTQRLRDMNNYPKYKNAFIKAFERLYKDKIKKGLSSVDRWKDGKEMFYWWIDENRTSVDPDQSIMFE